MLNIYKTDENGLIKKINKIENNSWIDLVNPTLEEIKVVVEKTKIPENLLVKLLDTEELPRIEDEGEATLIVVDVPFIEKNKHYATMPLGIITNKGYLVTIALAETEVLNEIKANKIKSLYTSKKTRFIIQLLHKVSTLYVKYLKLINNGIETREKVLIKSTSNKELINLMNIQKSLVYFVTSLKANDILLEKLSNGSVLDLYAEDVDLLEDAMIESRQGIETANIYREIVARISDTYATVISNNLNGIMKFLAGITIVSTIPTMVASFMGMNVPLGSIVNNDYALIIIITISMILAAVIAIILKNKDML
ncbi:MAG: magnesium transporter CorA family protein [Bacilli bacterium]|nr:magnesium transporter CorA family protein [Bacilli bacterium]MDD3304586.1 magnesium transporter CorA family protein [Bacilli bacterium]MDD4053770.1 magnesium transporter CorA family protein [Bacilli bacterium]MDD4411673.1 magnesium transporter CorA family protein [Bacilli bacterium]